MFSSLHTLSEQTYENKALVFGWPIAVELASLDGAVVLDNSGKILSYGAILQPKKRGRLSGSEGSRTKAAIGASNYGPTVKISADGGIVIYHKGVEFISILDCDVLLCWQTHADCD